jgi:hypothetical protein
MCNRGRNGQFFVKITFTNQYFVDALGLLGGYSGKIWYNIWI